MSKKDAEDRFLAAAANGDQFTVERLLAEGVDIDTVDRKRRTAALLASTKKHYDLLGYLIAAGADIDKQDEICLNPFLYGCVNNDIPLVRMMIKAGADLNRYTRFGGVGIHPAAEKGYVELVRELLETTEINVNHTNWVGWTPLLEAILLQDGGRAQQEIVRLLLQNRANPHLTDKYGRSPLQLARERGFDEIASILVAAGAG